MRTSYKCIPCFFRQIEAACSLIDLKKEKVKDLLTVLTKELLQFDFSQPPVVFGRTIYKNISRISGTRDIFGREKIRIERHLLKLGPYIKKVIKKAKDPLYTAAKMCCAANAIDFGTGKVPDIKKVLPEIKRIKLQVDHFPIFKDKLKTIKKLLIIGDNCGEAFFDRFFIEEILKDSLSLKIFYAVRSSPIINDVLISDAKRFGIDILANLISSGCDYPGLVLSKTSNYFRRIYSQADAIISKGQGNFESLQDKRKDIFYLFQIKCVSVSQFLSLPVNSLLFIHSKTRSD